MEEEKPEALEAAEHHSYGPRFLWKGKLQLLKRSDTEGYLSQSKNPLCKGLQRLIF